MARLDRTYCDICGSVLPPMGYVKIKDGNICGDCSRKISPFIKNKREASTDFLRRHIKYREENQKRLRDFKPAISFGYDKKIYIDPYMSGFVVTGKKEEDIVDDNPDIIMLSQVKSCDTDIKEITKEEFDIDENGKKVSFFPPHIKYYYDFKTEIVVESEWFDRIVVDLNGESVSGRGSIRYQKCAGIAKQLKDTLLLDNHKKRNGFTRQDNNLFTL